MQCMKIWKIGQRKFLRGVVTCNVRVLPRTQQGPSAQPLASRTDLQAEANNIIYWEKPGQHHDSKEDSNGNYQLNISTKCC